MNHEQATKILVVDDEPLVCDLLSRWLTAESYACTTASSGEAAIELLRKEKYHLVVTDIVMPGMSGIDLMTIVKELFPDVAVIMVSAVADRKTAIMALEVGAYGYVIKPFDKNEILINVCNALERRRLTLVSQEHGRALKAKVQLNEKYRKLFRFFPYGISEFALARSISSQMTDEELLDLIMEARVTDSNIEFARSHGYDKVHDVQGARFREVFSPGGKAEELCRTWIQNSFSSSSLETKENKANGSWRYFENTLLGDVQNGRLSSYWWIRRDITDRKRAENIMLARFRLVEYSISHSLDELLQATLDEVEVLTDSLIGFYHFVAPDQKTLCLQAWSTRTLREMCTAEGKGLHYGVDEAGVWVDCVHERRPVIHNDYSVLPHRKGMPAGHANVIRELVVPVFRGHRIVAILGVGNKPVDYDGDDIETVSLLADLAWDITERKQAEEALRESQERLELAMEGADLGMWDWNVQTGALVFNRRCAEMLGYFPDEIRPHIDSWEELLHPEDVVRVRKILHRHLEGATPSYEMEYRNSTKSGEWRWVLARGKVIERDKDGRPLRVTGTRLDITDRKRAEELLRERTEALERSNRDLEQFAYVAAHDLREPLVAVGTYLKLLERCCTENLNADAREFLSRTIETTLRMDTVIQDLLAYSRIGNDGHHQETTDCGAVLKNALSNLHSAVTKSGAVVTSDALPILMANASQMLQLFQNLLSNAIKFRGDEPLKIHVGCVQGNGEFQFSVKDNGIGIEPPYFERIFRIFQRIQRGSDRSGTGIGLANCKKIVECHGGRIWVESEPGRGSTFFFTLPDWREES